MSVVVGEGEEVRWCRGIEVGDVTSIPFPDGSFDLVWSKLLLQFVPHRPQALAELRRVTRSGGRIVCCNADHVYQTHYPVDEQLQADSDRWVAAASRELGVDLDVGRKLPHMFKKAGLVDVRVNFIPDKTASGFGGDPERIWNLETQLTAAMPFTAKVFGNEEAARDYNKRLIARFSDPDVYFYNPLFYVEGLVP